MKGHASRISAVKTAAVLAWTLAIAYSLAPFDFSVSVLRSRIDDPASLILGPVANLADMALHFAAFVVVGMLHRLAFAGSTTRIRPWPMIAAVTACVAIEAGQLTVIERHAALVDLLTNGFALLLGAVMARSAERRLRRFGDRLRSHGAPAFRWSALILWALFWSVALVYPYRLTRLDGWDPSYALVVGDEFGGGRAWSGEIDYVAFYDHALEGADAAATARRAPGTAEGTALRTTLGLVEGYEFGRTALAAMRGPGTKARAASTDTAALIRRLVATGTFAIEVWCTPAAFPQTGPARIVGISNGIWMRNVTLGQEGRALEFRVRNNLNGPNGITFALRSREFLTSKPVHIVATYAHGLSTIYVDGRWLGDSIDLRSPAVILGLGTTSVGSAAAWLIAGLSFVLGLGVGRRPKRVP